MGPVRQDRDLDVLWDGSLQLRQHRLDAINRGDDVGVGLTLDREQDGTLPIVPGGQQVVLRSIEGVSDILDPHRRAVAVGDDQLIIGIWIEKLVIGVDGIGSPWAVKCALRQIDVGLADDIAHVFEADAARGQRLRIDLNPDRRLLLAADADRAYSRYL